MPAEEVSEVSGQYPDGKIFQNIYLCVVIVSNLLCRRGDRVTGRPARSGGAHLG